MREFFNNPYPGIQTVLENMLAPILGEYTEHNQDILDTYPEKKHIANSANITQIKRVANFSLEDRPLEIFDITLSANARLQYSRVNIQRVVRSIMDVYTGALMFFHYDDNQGDWRISFVEKDETLTSTTPTKRYTYLVGEDHAVRTVTERFKVLANAPHKTVEALRYAFSVEALSNEFFDKYRTLYADFVEYITGKRFVKKGSKWEEKFVGKPDENDLLESIFENDEKAVRDYVKKTMGRLVFLQFLQKKGWLDVPIDEEWGNGNKNYLQDLFKNSEHQDDFLEKVLEPLFFNTLNTKRENQIATTVPGTNGKIPYLNGGLFENDLDDDKTVIFPKRYFENLLNFFGEYNFTIDENDPNDQEIGIDPEMLGKIFENLLEDNKDKGAYYTPKEIVQYMCREALIAYLSESYDKTKTRLLVTTHNTENMTSVEKQHLAQRLKDVKICDPAIGSGAFPMGMLNELFTCRTAIEGYNANSAQIKREIIQNNIYGVDIEKGAIDIARLRFWLAIVVESDTPEPLPNFDYKFMQGNSLLESFEGVDLSNLTSTDSNLKVVEPERDLFGNIKDGQLKVTYTKTDSLVSLQANINKFFKEDNHDTKSLLRNKIEEQVREQLIYNIDLRSLQAERIISELSHTSNLSIKQNKAISDANEKVALYLKIKAEVETMPMVNNKFFLWHTWFADVFYPASKQGGFDIVLGNPPYVEAKKLKHIASTLKKHYSIYSGTADLSIYFIEKGIFLLKENGILTYITTNKFFNTGYGEPVRKYLSELNINQIINFEQVEVFEGILVSSVVFNIQNCPKTSNKKLVYEEFYKLKAKEFRYRFVERQNYFGTYQQKHLDEREWSFADTSGLLLKSKIEQNATILKNIEGVSVYRGVTTGFNSAFIISNDKRDELISKDIKNANVIKKMLQGRNIRKWHYNKSDENLLFTRRGFSISDYPDIENYLSQFYNKLKPKTSSTDEEGRKPGIYKWYEILDNTAYYQHFEKSEKIIWGLTADKWAFAYDDKQHYLPSNGYILTSEIVPVKYILGLLNSKLMHYYFGFIGVMTAGGAYTLKASTIEALPIIVAVDKLPIVTLVNQILEAKQENPQADTSELENEIDQLVYQLYGITDAEIEVVESR